MATQDFNDPLSETPNFDVGEAAPMVHVSARTLRRLAGRGEISHYKVGRRLLFSAHDIAEFLSRSKISAHE